MLIVGHRGAGLQAPENTDTGFKAGYASGLRAFELDVQLTKDEQLAVIHDSTVDRTTDGTGQVSDMTMAELKELDAGVRYGTSHKAKILSLSELYWEYKGKASFQVEIKKADGSKYAKIAQLIKELVDSTGMTDSTVVISFEPEALRAIREISPEQKMYYLTDLKSEETIGVASELGCVGVSVNWAECLDSCVSEAIAQGLEVYGWNIDKDETRREDNYKRALRLGINGVVSDAPSDALKYFRK